jgi:hypothetical protein
VEKAWHGSEHEGPSEEKLLSIRLLGAPEVSIEERTLRFGTKKAPALLCYLVAEGGIQGRS